MANISEKTAKTRFISKHKILAKNIKDKIENGEEFKITEEIESVGYSRSMARTQSARIMSTEGFKQALLEVGMLDQGKKVLDEAMQAQQGAWYKGKFYKEADPDHQTRLKALSLLGDFTGSKITRIEQKSVNVNLTPEQTQELLDKLL